MNKTIVTMLLIILSMVSCNEETKTKHQLDECSEIKIMIEDCMNLHRGAFAYLENCGSLDLEQVKSYQSCDELLEHVGINKR